MCVGIHGEVELRCAVNSMLSQQMHMLKGGTWRNVYISTRLSRSLSQQRFQKVSYSCYYLWPIFFLPSSFYTLHPHFIYDCLKWPCIFCISLLFPHCSSWELSLLFLYHSSYPLPFLFTPFLLPSSFLLWIWLLNFYFLFFVLWAFSPFLVF